jgi:transposase-like protein
MSTKGYRISKEMKDQIINRIKNEGVSVKQAADEHGVKAKTIYSWLGTKAQGTVSILEHNKLKKENTQLKQLIGDITLKLSEEQKRG